MNDLWRFNPSVNQWTWVGGDNIIDQPGIYGIKGTAATLNIPGSRYSSASWTDASGNFLLCGGVLPPLGSVDVVNDLWSYNPTSNLWTWISGDNTINQSGIYGTKGIVAPGNKPGSRHSLLSWTDASGNLFLFGGGGYASSTKGNLNDLWKYSFKVNSPLPVSLISFDAVRQNSHVLLNWSTSEEHNSKHYSIEHSMDGVNFNSIGMITAAANTRSVTNYQYADYSPSDGNNFYRLKQVDADNKYTYSIVRKVDFNATGFSYTILQNPVYNSLRLSLHLSNAGKSNFEIRDAAGRLYVREEKTFAVRSIIHTITINNLAKGAYYITVRTGKEFITKGFLIQ